MSDSESLVARAFETLVGWLAQGHELRAHPLAGFVRDARTPIVYDANFAADVRASEPDEIDAYASSDEVVLVLEGELASRGPRAEIRPATTDADWQVVQELCRLDHEEEAEKGFHRPWEPEVTRQLVLAKRLKAPAVRYFVARADGVDCAFFSAWPGENGVGKVEDLFTRADFRGRGLGTALIAACVDDARARGAGPVLIGARSNDTPKHMYAALGFRPLCVQRCYVKTTEP